MPMDAQLTPPDAAETLELIAPDTRGLNVYAGVDAVSQYISRGLVFTDDFSIQPWIEFDVSLAQPAEGPLTSVSGFFGNWNNITGSGPEDGRVRTGATADVENWYEADVYGGVRLTWFGLLQTSLRYNWYTSPANSFDEIHELDARVSIDDTGFWSERVGIDNFSMTPNIRVARELDDSGGPEQWYIAPRLSPTLTVDSLPLDPSFTVPLAAGFGADGQYVDSSGDEHAFGFFQTGLHVSVPVGALPEGRGSLSATAGVDVIILSDEGLSADGNRHETVFRFGISYAY